MALSLELVENKYSNRKNSVSNAFIDKLYSIGINKIFYRTYKNISTKQRIITKEYNKNFNNSNNGELKLPQIYNNFIVSNSDNILKKIETNDPDVDFYENRQLQIE